MLRLTPHHFWSSPSRGPASVLSHGVERSPNKKGKEFVKFVDGLANVAGNRPPDAANMLLNLPAAVLGGYSLSFLPNVFTSPIVR